MGLVPGVDILGMFAVLVGKRPVTVSMLTLVNIVV